jgi:hypothetical protein
MPKDEALADAIGQFEAQGVNLAPICTTGIGISSTGQAEPDLACVSALQNIADLIGDEDNVTALTKQEELEVTGAYLSELDVILQDLATGGKEGVCSADDESVKHYKKCKVGQSGGLPVLIALVTRAPFGEEGTLQAQILCEALECLRVSLANHPDNKRLITGTKVTSGTTLSVAAIERVLASDTAVHSVKCKAVAVMRTAAYKCEDNKSLFCKSVPVLTFLRAVVANTGGAEVTAVHTQLVQEACMAMKVLTTPDDLSVDFSGAFDFANVLVAEKPSFMTHLLHTVKHHAAYAGTVADAFMAMKQLCLTKEGVDQFGELRGLQCCVDMLQKHPGEKMVVRAVFAVLRHPASNDKQKSKIMDTTIPTIAVSLLSTYLKEAMVVEQVGGVFASLCIRSPDNSQTFADLGAIPLIVSSIKIYLAPAVDDVAGRPPAQSKHFGLLRQMCLSLRNMAARSPQLRQSILDEGAEDPLRQAERIYECSDEAFGALRDLQLPLKFKRAEAASKVKAMIGKTNDTNKEMARRVAELDDAALASGEQANC